MVNEIGKFRLRAVEPGSRQRLMESHATRDAVAARRAALEQAGYRVVVTLIDGESAQLERRRVFLHGGGRDGAQPGPST